MAETPGPPEGVPKDESSAQGQEEQIVSESVPVLPLLPVGKPPGFPSFRKRSIPWAMGLQQKINRTRASLLSTATDSQSDEDRALSREIRVRLDQAEFILERFERRSWVTRLVSAGAVYEEILAIVQVISEDLLLIEDDALVQARLPALRAGIKAYLGSDDPRFDEYTRIIDRITQSGESNDPVNLWQQPTHSDAGEVTDST